MVNLGLVIWVTSVFLICLGTLLTLKRLRSQNTFTQDYNTLPISIIKPLKGIDEGLEANLESFFFLDYPDYELLFSVAESLDPVIPLVQKLIEKYPNSNAKLIVGDLYVGLNPKINNMMRPYLHSIHDLILVSDSNVRVNPGYLKNVVESIDEKTGVISAVIAGIHPQGLGGNLESIYLNTYYARAMNLADFANHPCVVGKSMLFRKSTAKKFGGLKALSNYLAEDYMAGQLMQKNGFKVKLMSTPINQFIGSHRFKTFWDRHVRWSRIRKMHAPLAYFSEIILNPIFIMIVIAVTTSSFFLIITHLLIALLQDYYLNKKFNNQMSFLKFAAIWLLREVISVILWSYGWIGNSVKWRGHKIDLLPGGQINTSTNIPLKLQKGYN